MSCIPLQPATPTPERSAERGELPYSLSQPGRVEALAFQATASASAPPVSWGMPEYRRGAHTIFEIHLHLVWVTKYRRPALAGDVAVRVRDLIRDICGQHEVKIMKGHVAKDHVHLFLSIPPQVTISRLLQWLKGKTAHHLLAEFPHLKKQFWGRHLWARGYFCCSSGNVTDETIAEYIANQNETQDEDFRVDG
jgi:putative transposase